MARRTGSGTLVGFLAYLLWGLVPVYWQWLAPATSLEILAHRAVWSVLFLYGAILVQKRTKSLLAVLRNCRSLSLLLLAASLIGINWSIFIWAVTVHRIADSSLGYYVTPLVNVALGVYFLGERLRRVQWIALGIAGLAVVYLTVELRAFPWVAITLAVTFGLYGYVKKAANVPALESLTVETLALTPFAIAYFIWLQLNDKNTFVQFGLGHALTLASAGIVTAIPLLMYGYAAVRIPLTTIGMLQYVSPTMSFLLAVFVLHEPMPPARLHAFFIVWFALTILSIDMLRNLRTTHTLPIEPD